MQYNTLNNAITTVNIIDGNVALVEDQIRALIGVSATSVKTLIATTSGVGRYDKLILEFDLGVRLYSGEMRYYFDSDVSSTALVSGILFQYKDELFQDYTSLPVYSNQGYYNTNVSGMDFAPRYIRFTHDLVSTSGFLTTLSGYVEGGIRGLELYNDDSYVDFGTDGLVEGDNVYIGVDAEVDVRPFVVYNSGLNTATAYISVGPNYTDLDKVLGVATTVDGPWVYALDEEFSIARAGESDTYGVYNNTELRDGYITITGYSNLSNNFATQYQVGDYTTKVFSYNDATWKSIIVDRMLPLEGTLQVDTDDGAETIQVRSSHSKPKSYHIYREVYGYIEATRACLRYTDKWVETGFIKEAPAINLIVTEWSSPSMEGWKDYFITVDPKTERWGGFAFARISESNYNSWYIFNTDADINTVSKRMAYAVSDTLTFNWKAVKFDTDGGMWLYFYAVVSEASDFVDETGYYLCYFDKELDNKFKYVDPTDFLGVMDIDYNSKYVWYTIPASREIRKLYYNGTVAYSHYVNTDDLGGLCVLPDGGVWYANGKDLYKLNSFGTMDEDSTLEDVADVKFTAIVLDNDGSEALWALEDSYISRVLLYGENKGQKEFSVYVDFALRLYPVDGGVWVWSADVDNPGEAAMHYISKANRRVDKEHVLENNSTPGVWEHTYEGQMYASKMPLAIDDVWSGLEWNKVNTESFILPEDKYNQVKTVLRRQTPYQKYGNTVDVDSVFHTDDSFVQTSSVLDPLVWGEYLGNSRVYVENNQLVMTNDLLGDYDAYVNTKNKYVLTDNFDVQFDYIIGDGNQSTIEENIYLRAYTAGSIVVGGYIEAHLTIATISLISYIRCTFGGSFTSKALGSGYDRWTGKLRLRRNGDQIYALVWDPQISTWISTAAGNGANGFGDHFYLQIVAPRTGSNIYISNFTVTEGTACYYTGTPKVKGVYVQKDVELGAISSSKSKTAYLKSYVSNSMVVDGHYDTSLKVRWRVPV